MPDNPRDRLAKLLVERVVSINTSISNIRNDPTIKTYLTVIINICGIYVQKFIYIMTRKVYVAIKANNTSSDR